MSQLDEFILAEFPQSVRNVLRIRTESVDDHSHRITVTMKIQGVVIVESEILGDHQYLKFISSNVQHQFQEKIQEFLKNFIEEKEND